jgi:hypothetical protein
MEDVIYELMWQNADKSHDVKFVVLKDEAYDEFQKLQRDDIIKVKLSTLINRGSSFSELEWDSWYNPKFKAFLNSRMSDEEAKQYMNFLKQRKMKRQQYFGKDSLAEVRALIKKLIREVMEGEKTPKSWIVQYRGRGEKVWVTMSDKTEEKFNSTKDAIKKYPQLKNIEPKELEWDD